MKNAIACRPLVALSVQPEQPPYHLNMISHHEQVMAYRRALSTEEAKVVTQQRETKELRERIAELQASKPGMAGGAGVLGMTASSKFFSSSSAASTARDRKGSTRKKKGGMIKSVESIYTPLSTGSLPKISANNTGYGRF